MKRLKKSLATVLSLALALSSMATTVSAENTERTTSPFPGDQSLTIHSSEGDTTTHNYLLYQIFNGEYSDTDGTLSNIHWGDSIVGKDSAGHDYDLSSALITALKADTLPDGEENPIASYYSGLYAVDTTVDGKVYKQSTANAVAKAFQQEQAKGSDSAYDASDTNNDTNFNMHAYATIVYSVLRDATCAQCDDHLNVVVDSGAARVENTKTVNTYGEDGQVVSTTEVLESVDYVFSDIEIGYYLVDEGAMTGDEPNYSRFIVQVATPDVQVTAKTSAYPPLDKNVLLDLDGDGEAEKYKDAEVTMSSIYKFELTSTVPDMTYYSNYYFNVHDTISAGLTFIDPENELYSEYPITVTISNAEDNNGASSSVTVPVVMEKDATETTGDKYYKLDNVDNADGTTSLNFVFHDFKQYNSQKGYTVTITYYAQVNENAVIGDGSAADSNQNTAYLVYSNNPNYEYDGLAIPNTEDPSQPPTIDEDRPNTNDPNEPTGRTPDVQVHLYTTGIKLHKVNSDGDGLAGATFEIKATTYDQVYETKQDFVVDNENGTYYELKDGTYTETVPDETNFTSYAESQNWDEFKGEATYTTYKIDTVNEMLTPEGTGEQTITRTVGEDGYLDLSGLKSGTYTITETVAPNRYERVEAPFQIIIAYIPPATDSASCTWVAKIVDTVEDEQDALELVTFTQPDDTQVEDDIVYMLAVTDDQDNIVGYTNTDGEGNAVTASTTGAEAFHSVTSAVEGSNGRIDLDVENVAAAVLPSTGGRGTTVIYVVGSTLALAALVLLITKRRMHQMDR